MILKKVFNTPFPWFLLILVVFESAAWLLSPYRQQPIAAEVVRNATTWRGWPEYLRSPVPKRSTVAIISNSQGVGREMSDPADIYPAQIRSMAREQGLPFTVENWSLEGIRLAEVEMLTMQAVKRQVSLLVLVLSPGSLDASRRLSLDYGASDVDLTAGDPALWPLLMHSSLREYITVHDVLKRSIFFHSSFARSRIPVHDMAASWLDPPVHRTFFGQRKIRFAHLDLAQSLERPARIPRQRRYMPAERWRQLMEIQHRPVFEALFGPLQERLRVAKVRLLWVWMPLPQGYAGEAAVKGIQEFQADLCKSIDDAGFTCVDLSDAVPDDDFLTFYQWTHLSKQGHRLFAERLFSLLRDAVH